MTKKVIIPLVIVVIVAGGFGLYFLLDSQNKLNDAHFNDLQTANKGFAEENGALTKENDMLSKELTNVKKNRDCVPYNKDTWELEKADWYYVPNEMIQLLDEQWDDVTFCREDNKYVIQVRKEYIDDTQPDAELLETTRQYFPIAGRELNPINTLTEYQYYLFSAEPINLELNGQNKTLPGNELIPLASFVWESALSFCREDLSLYDGTFDISCGSGDNMCIQFERVRLNLITNVYSSLGMCASDCDLTPGQPHTYRCGENITPPWQDS